MKNKNRNKQKGGGNGYYPNFDDSPCGGVLMYNSYTNHLTANEFNDITSMQKLDNVANMNGGKLMNPKTKKWVNMKSKEGLQLCKNYMELAHRENKK